MSHIDNLRIFHLNTNNRISGTHENCQMELELPSSEEFDRVVLLSCVIPRSYYLIQAPYNTFILKEFTDETTITVEEGNYSFSSFRAYLEALLNASSARGWTYSVSIPNTTNQPSTGKYTYSLINGPPIIFGGEFSFIFPSTSKLHEQMGFDLGSTNVNIGTSIKSKNVVKFTLEDTLYIHSDLVSGQQDDVLQEVFTAGSFDFSSIKFQNYTPIEYSKVLSTSSNNTYRFTITDEDDRIINLNGLNCVYTVLIYKNNDIHNVQKDFIKYQLLKK